ncbi:MAG: tetratricopeptide repeat protein [Syntrophales bacterium]|nr:tetratricopeptide repeat protein [Syntrophales bacterium]
MNTSPLYFVSNVGSEIRRAIICSLLLSFAVLCIYFQVQDFKFVYYDDDVYTTGKLHIMKGVTWEGVRWAITATEAGFWHPLTWLSLMLDMELFGLNTGAFHWTNVVIHLASSIIFFLFLKAATDDVKKSFLVAILFAVHPLHVESVAWVAQRKDVLSTLFGFASLLAYVRYARLLHWGWYIGTFLFFILALMAKPMVVTFPVVMLLLDLWPLRRFPETPIKRLFFEKIPFFVASFAASLLVIYTEKKVGAITPLEDLGLLKRIANALVSYVKYVVLTIFPNNLTFHYPYPDYIPAWQVVGALFFLLGVTIFVLSCREKYPYLAVGWFWYLITLFPVCGIIQIGPHAIADRYSYVTINGLFLMCVWGIEDCARTKLKQMIINGFWVAVIVAFSIAAWFQTGYWRNTETLMERALRVTDRNFIAMNNLGAYYIDSGNPFSALPVLCEALKIKPQLGIIHFNLGRANYYAGNFDGALESFHKAFDLSYRRDESLWWIARVYGKLGEWKKASEIYERVLAYKIDDCSLRFEYAWALKESKEVEGAKKELFFILKREPHNVQAAISLIDIFMDEEDFDRGISLGEEMIGEGYVDEQLFRKLSQVCARKGFYGMSVWYASMAEKMAEMGSPEKLSSRH